ncbi:MAG TPA: patatin-like phospholipase family protein [Pseudonocardiaceae bacterium]|jgi:NTE family protein
MSSLSGSAPATTGNQTSTAAGKTDLVLEGGGIKGIGLVGAVNTLRASAYPDIHRVAGTSAGAIVAALIAAGMSAERMEEVMRGLDYAKFEDAGLLPHLGLPGKIVEILLHGGSYKTDYMHRWISGQLEACGVRTWRDLKYTDAGADSTLSDTERYKLVVIVSDISRGRMLRLPWDYQRLCDLDPDDIPVADAVVASASIPFFFRAQHLTCGRVQGHQKLTLTDGGSLSDYPIDVFDRTDGEPNRWPTLGVKLSARRTPAAEWSPIHTPLQMLKRLFETMSSAHDARYVDEPSVQARTIFVDTTGVSATDFGLDQAARDRLFSHGREAATKFLAGWDWAGWQQTYQKRPADLPPGTREFAR